MTYILNKNIALRSWWRVPYAYYMKGVRDAQRLTKEEFELLSLCDGQTDLADSELLSRLVAHGLIEPCEKGEKTLDAWQKMDCDNRYFPAMNWMITGKCNYNCLHCFNASDNSPLMAEFSLEEAEKLLDEAQRCGINAFTVTGEKLSVSTYTSASKVYLYGSDTPLSGDELKKYVSINETKNSFNFTEDAIGMSFTITTNYIITNFNITHTFKTCRS